ncbi:uncharacterized protein LOC102567186 isoform X1 [Alligator mississippiensis]|nr:uncharacterized protein LOC102567186 isoform X1 [Alligator mississippiensis]
MLSYVKTLMLNCFLWFLWCFTRGGASRTCRAPRLCSKNCRAVHQKPPRTTQLAHSPFPYMTDKFSRLENHQLPKSPPAFGLPWARPGKLQPPPCQTIFDTFPDRRPLKRIWYPGLGGTAMGFPTQKPSFPLRATVKVKKSAPSFQGCQSVRAREILHLLENSSPPLVSEIEFHLSVFVEKMKRALWRDLEDPASPAGVIAPDVQELTKETTASAAVIKDLKGSKDSSYRTLPSSPNSTSSHRSSTCSLAQLVSANTCLSSITSDHSSFISQNAMYSKLPSPMPSDITSQVRVGMGAANGLKTVLLTVQDVVLELIIHRVNILHIL